MGYETKIELYDVRVSPDKVTEVAEAIASTLAGEGHSHWMVGSLKLGKRGNLLWNDSSAGVWKSHEEFIADVAVWRPRGWIAFRSCEGDGASWAYEFDGAGDYCVCTTRRVAAIKAAATRKKRKAAATRNRK